MTTQTEQVLIAMSTCPNREIATSIAQTLVQKHLAACVNIVPNVQSIYEWQGKIESDDEVILLIKTTQTQFDTLQKTLTELHPYELPELVGVCVTAGFPAYLDWVIKATGTTS